MKKGEFMNWSRDFNALLKVKWESMLLIFFLKRLLVIIHIFIAKIKICQKDSTSIRTFILVLYQIHRLYVLRKYIHVLYL